MIVPAFIHVGDFKEQTPSRWIREDMDLYLIGTLFLFRNR